ncbi:MAG: hypothetical protein WDO14_08905 [Bacteroidota bacterium]
MEQKQMKSNLSYITIGLTAEYFAQLRYAAARAGSNEANVVAAGIELYMRMLDAKENKSDVIIEHPDGRRVRVFLADI